MKQTVIHKELLQKAKRYLIGTRQCNPVFIERGSASLCEFPDVIGWDARECVVIECKASLEDFRADKKKACRTNGDGLGSQRFFLVPIGIQQAVEKELPDGWGLLVDDRPGLPGTFIRQVRFKNSGRHKRNFKAEVLFLRSRVLEIQRFGV